MRHRANWIPTFATINLLPILAALLVLDYIVRGGGEQRDIVISFLLIALYAVLQLGRAGVAIQQRLAVRRRTIR